MSDQKRPGHEGATEHEQQATPAESTLRDRAIELMLSALQAPSDLNRQGVAVIVDALLAAARERQPTELERLHAADVRARARTNGNG
jgi:hypothetical protein